MTSERKNPHIVVVVGTRPEVLKLIPVIDALKERVSKDVQSIIEEMAVPAETVGYQVMQAVLSNEFYIFCDDLFLYQI